jgi:superoxide dismutase, Cu-Zn family
MQSLFRPLMITAVAAAVLAGCAAPGHDDPAAHGGAAGMHDHHARMMMKGPMAVATLTPTQGSSVRGLVMFHQHEGQLMVHARLSGLKPNGEHGFHLHDKGDCASTDGTSAGGHFNPDGQPHGPQDAAHHAGDMPSLKADAQGHADVHFMLCGPGLDAGQPGYIVGRSVIVHANPDDYATQPTGNAGARLACGVIAAAMQ